MDTTPLKSFATKARTDLIKEVGARVTVVLSENSLARVESAPAVRALEEAIASDGREQVVDRVAYTWFNRIIALRFMDVNGYTQSGVVSPESGRAIGQPEVLAEAKAGTFDSAVVPIKTQETITALLNGTRPSQDAQGEAYGMLLEAYCRSWHKTMPFMFEREGDYTELLIPTALLSEGSVRDQAVKTLAKEACNEVEVIGWLYQFYISERKDEVFQGFKKNKKAGAAEIPAATQLFTPHWIVRYLVENSLGRLWVLNNPSSRLAEQMDYYIKPVDEEIDFLRVTKPEELKVIDPAVGSGHMLTYAFDLLYAIYTEKGYDPAEIPRLILQHNLFGIEIDPRAGALAAFALTMKATEKRKLFLKNPVQPNIRVLENVHFDPAELDYLWSLTKANGFVRGDADEFWNAFEHADTFGSLIRPKEQLLEPLKAVVDGATADGDLFQDKVVEKATAVVANAEYLTREYAVAVANPPYMGSKQMNALLSQFMKDKYPDGKSDLFAGFIERCTGIVRARGLTAMITMQSWMFLRSYEKLRASLLTKQRAISMLHLGARAFDSIGGEVVSSTAFVLANLPLERRGAAWKRAGSFIRLVDGTSEVAKIAALSTALATRTKEAGFHLASNADFTAIPGAPIAYWLSEKMRTVFTYCKKLGAVAEIKHGLSTGKNEAVVRLWWETSTGKFEPNCNSPDDVDSRGKTWFPYNSGGQFRRWYGNVEKVLRYDKAGRDVMATFPGHRHDGRARYFQPGVTWSKVSSGAPAFRSQPVGQVFDVAGNGFFLNDAKGLSDLLGFCNSNTAQAMLAALSPTLNFEAGQIAKLPIPSHRDVGLEERVEQLVLTSKFDWESAETSWDFQTNPLVELGRASDTNGS